MQIRAPDPLFVSTCLHFTGVLRFNSLTSGPSRARLALAAIAFVIVAAAWSQAPASATVQERLDQTQGKISEANQKKGVLSQEIAGLSQKIDDYESQVAALRAEERDAEARLATKQAELDQAQAEVRDAYKELEALAARLQRSLKILSDRLVAIYQSGSSDMTDLLLASADYGELVEQSEYLSHIQDRDQTIAGRVRDLRDQQKATVVRLKKAKDTIESARDEIAAEEQNLATARQAVEDQQGELLAVRGAAQRRVGPDRRPRRTPRRHTGRPTGQDSGADRRGFRPQHVARRTDVGPQRGRADLAGRWPAHLRLRRTKLPRRRRYDLPRRN